MAYAAFRAATAGGLALCLVFTAGCFTMRAGVQPTYGTQSQAAGFDATAGVGEGWGWGGQQAIYGVFEGGFTVQPEPRVAGGLVQAGIDFVREPYYGRGIGWRLGFRAGERFLLDAPNRSFVGGQVAIFPWVWGGVPSPRSEKGWTDFEILENVNYRNLGFLAGAMVLPESGPAQQPEVLLSLGLVFEWNAIAGRPSPPRPSFHRPTPDEEEQGRRSRCLSLTEDWTGVGTVRIADASQQSLLGAVVSLPVIFPFTQWTLRVEAPGHVVARAPLEPQLAGEVPLDIRIREGELEVSARPDQQQLCGAQRPAPATQTGQQAQRIADAIRAQWFTLRDRAPPTPEIGVFVGAFPSGNGLSPGPRVVREDGTVCFVYVPGLNAQTKVGVQLPPSGSVVSFEGVAPAPPVLDGRGLALVEWEVNWGLGARCGPPEGSLVASQLRRVDGTPAIPLVIEDVVRDLRARFAGDTAPGAAARDAEFARQQEAAVGASPPEGPRLTEDQLELRWDTVTRRLHVTLGKRISDGAGFCACPTAGRCCGTAFGITYGVHYEIGPTGVLLAMTPVPVTPFEVRFPIPP